ncbi:dihydrolipoamide succinyltransferase, partial [Lysobacter sp. 2RAB21]
MYLHEVRLPPRSRVDDSRRLLALSRRSVLARACAGLLLVCAATAASAQQDAAPAPAAAAAPAAHESA